MLLVYTPKITSRLDFVFKHICTRILGLQVEFTTDPEDYDRFEGAKMVYGKQNLGESLFVESHGLLQQLGFEDVNIQMGMWDEVPCFFACRRHSMIDYDIFAAAFYLLSRYEEYLPHVKDELGRFPAAKSLANREGFLDRPVVDIWAMKFGRELRKFFPQLVFGDRHTCVHHWVSVETPYMYQNRGLLHNLVGGLSDLYHFRLELLLLRVRVLLKLRKDPYNVFTWLVNASKSEHLSISVVFRLGQSERFKDYINTARKRVQMLIKFVADYTDTGLLLGGKSLQQLSTLQDEQKLLESLTHRPLAPAAIVRQRIDLPHHYRMLVEMEVQKEGSMYYHDAPGFRAGTCTPFLFYDLDYEIKTPLTLQPLCAAPGEWEGSSPARMDTLKALFHQVDRVSGTFMMAFQNTDLIDRKQQKYWRKMLTTDPYEFFK